MTSPPLKKNRPKLVIREARQTSLSPAIPVQNELSWAAVAARNAGPSGPTMSTKDEQPAVEKCSNPLKEGRIERPGFHPMDALFERAPGDGSLAAIPSERGFSPRYQGNIFNTLNESANIPDSQNCSLLITGLPSQITVKKLLDSIMALGPLGKVSTTTIMRRPEDHFHPSPAARLSMWDRVSAERLFTAIENQKLAISGKTPKAYWDKIRVPAQSHLPAKMSRVLFISGPSHIVDVEKIYDFLNERMLYQTQRVVVIEESFKDRQIVWVFGSFRAQAQTARMALSRQWPFLRFRWLRDPMDIGANDTFKGLYDVYPGPDNQRIPRVRDNESLDV